MEIDGGQHARDENISKDKERDEWLRNQGFKVLRFWNNDVLNNINGVWEVIRKHCFCHPPLAPPVEEGNISRDCNDKTLIQNKIFTVLRERIRKH